MSIRSNPRSEDLLQAKGPEMRMKGFGKPILNFPERGYNFCQVE
jgi:hypothetical protein